MIGAGRAAESFSTVRLCVEAVCASFRGKAFFARSSNLLESPLLVWLRIPPHETVICGVYGPIFRWIKESGLEALVFGFCLFFSF